MKYVVSERVLETIERECRGHPDTETGGILVGFRDRGQVAITHATGPGINWSRSAHHFVKDTEYLQSVLNLLFQYFQVNYLGVWHKHPESMPYPSQGDVASAMEEIGDHQVGLDELVTPICVMEAGKVEVLPYVVRDNTYTAVSWQRVPHDALAAERSLQTQWYTRTVGQARLAKEMEQFQALGVEAEVKKGADDTYRFHVLLGSGSPVRLVMLCPAEYPVAPPEVAVYDPGTRQYEPVNLLLLDNWNIFQYMGDVVQEYQRTLPGVGVRGEGGTGAG
jgi:integrative and conjugative element protein (TIGR02256 family)